MRFPTRYVVAALLALCAPANAATFSFTTDPFDGSDALITPGRQIVGGELFLSFDISNDAFTFEPTVFGGENQVLFANDVAGNLPTTDANIVVLQTLDNDADPATPFGAGNAANLIADRITSPGPGFFIYFNSGLDMPRLVFSMDLSENTADLKILARMTNLAGQSDALPTFTATNFAFVPEPSSFLLLAPAIALLAFGATATRGKQYFKALDCGSRRRSNLALVQPIQHAGVSIRLLAVGVPLSESINRLE